MNSGKCKKRDEKLMANYKVERKSLRNKDSRYRRKLRKKLKNKLLTRRGNRMRRIKSKLMKTKKYKMILNKPKRINRRAILTTMSFQRTKKRSRSKKSRRSKRKLAKLKLLLIQLRKWSIKQVGSVNLKTRIGGKTLIKLLTMLSVWSNRRITLRTLH